MKALTKPAVKELADKFSLQFSLPADTVYQLVLELNTLFNPNLNFTAKNKVDLEDWLAKDLDLKSWLGYYPDKEFGASLAFPALFEAYYAAEQAKANLVSEAQKYRRVDLPVAQAESSES